MCRITFSVHRYFNFLSVGNQSEYISLNVRFFFWFNVELRINFLSREKRSFRLRKKFSRNSVSKSANPQNKRLYIAIGFSPLYMLIFKIRLLPRPRIHNFYQAILFKFSNCYYQLILVKQRMPGSILVLFGSFKTEAML